VTRKFVRMTVLVTLFAIAALPAVAQDYPSKPVRFVVPVAPGGITDIVARAAGDFIARKSGQPVVIENRTGAGGNIGSETVAKSVPDGYTLGVIATTQIAINPFVFKKMSYDPLNDLVPVAPIGEAPQFLVINAKVPATTLKDFIAYARKEAGKLNYVSLGPGSTVHLGGVQFTRLAEVEMQPVQYRGAAPGISDLVAGNVHLISVGIAPVKSLVEGGLLRVLAAGTRKRVSYLPDIPTAAEAGLPGYEVTTWFALFAPKGTPRPIVEWLNGAIREMNADQASARRLTDVNIDPMSMTADEFAALVKADAARWERIIRDAGLTPE
jgi:tripartite-type tricarboxylate transporter receptor subunit TctC